MNNIVDQIVKGFSKVSESLDNAKLPIWAKILGLVLVIGIIVIFVVDVISLGHEFYKNGLANYEAGKLVIETFFNGTVLAAIYAALKLLIDKNKNGVPDELEKEEEKK